MSIIETSLYDCYDYIIGLSRTECTCNDPKGDFSLDYNTSYSGLYIDELQPLRVLTGLENCEDSVWDIMNRARDNAIKSFVDDATRELLHHNELRVQPYSGVIGRRRNTSDRTITNTYAGVHIICKRIVGGKLTLKKIHTCFNFTGTVEVAVADNLGNTWGPYTLNTTEDTWVENDITDLELDMWSQYVDNVEYFIYYIVDDNQPRNNVACHIDLNYMVFNPNRPYYVRGHTDSFKWAESLMAGGFTTDDISRFDDITANYGGNNFLNGLNLEIDVDCDYGMLLCNDSPNFTSDPLAMAMAYAILYKSGEILADFIFSSPNLNFAKMVNRDYLASEQGDWIEKYKERIEYIGINTDVTKTDCLKCKDRQQINKTTIYS